MPPPQPLITPRCPTLRSVSTNIGTQSLDANSSLFKFSNLTSFSIIVRHGLPGSDPFLPAEELPHTFWDMILHRCPTLEELAICSFSSSARVFNFDRVVEGSWPALHSLTLGSFGYNEDFSLGPLTLLNDGAITRFLGNQRSLKYLRFIWNFRSFMSPDEVSFTLPSKSLPSLTTFIGIYQQLAKLDNPETIETLDLTCEPIYQTRMPAVCPILRSLPNLTSLEIWVHLFDPNTDNAQIFHGIMEACPKLTDLHFMCTNSFTSRQLKQLISGLHHLPKLKRFSLTKGHTYLDESMLATAVRIVKVAPKLKQVNVRWARERCPNHLKQEGNYDVLHSEASGVPTALAVVERGINFVGAAFSRQYRHTLRLGAPVEWQKTVSKTKNVVRKRVNSMLSIRGQ